MNEERLNNWEEKLAAAKAKYGRTFRTAELSPRTSKKSNYLRKLEKISRAKNEQTGTPGITVLQQYRRSSPRRG